jgi:hypothetical protein
LGAWVDLLLLHKDPAGNECNDDVEGKDMLRAAGNLSRSDPSPQHCSDAPALF